MNAYTTIQCHMRVFEFNATATKYDTFEGKDVVCHTMTKVKSCWGRCDSNEVLNFTKILGPCPSISSQWDGVDITGVETEKDFNM